MARRYEFYFRVAKQYFTSERSSKILFLPREKTLFTIILKNNTELNRALQ